MEIDFVFVSETEDRMPSMKSLDFIVHFTDLKAENIVSFLAMGGGGGACEYPSHGKYKPMIRKRRGSLNLIPH